MKSLFLVIVFLFFSSTAWGEGYGDSAIDGFLQGLVDGMFPDKEEKARREAQKSRDNQAEREQQLLQQQQQLLEQEQQRMNMEEQHLLQQQWQLFQQQQRRSSGNSPMFQFNGQPTVAKPGRQAGMQV